MAKNHKNKFRSKVAERWLTLVEHLLVVGFALALHEGHGLSFKNALVLVSVAAIATVVGVVVMPKDE